jgi:plastocyanin
VGVAWRIFCVLTFCLLFAGGYAFAATTNVTLTAKGPEPATVTIDWADTVVFSNADTVTRTVISQRAGIESPPISPGGTFEHRFDGRSGTYGFVQSGPRPVFTGAVVVTPVGKVTLKVAREVAPYGSTIAFTGRSSYAGTPVLVQFRQTGATVWATVLNRTAGSDGSFSGRLKVTSGGRLRALVAGGEISSEFEGWAAVPRVQASVNRRRVPRGAKIIVSGRVVPASAVESVNLEERAEGRPHWLRKATMRVPKSGKVTFVLKAASGRTLLRLSMKRDALEPGFEPVVSKAITVVGT